MAVVKGSFAAFRSMPVHSLPLSYHHPHLVYEGLAREGGASEEMAKWWKRSKNYDSVDV